MHLNARYILAFIGLIVLSTLLSLGISLAYNPVIEKVPIECLFDESECQQIRTGSKQSVENIEITKDMSRQDLFIFLNFGFLTLSNIFFFGYKFFKSKETASRIRILLVTAFIQILLLSFLLALVAL